MLEKLPEAVGHALRDRRAGLDDIVFNRISLRGGTASIEVRSPAFADHTPIPPAYTADGEGLSPPLEWRGVPAAATTLVVIVEDADSPTPHPFVQAIVAELPAQTTGLVEGAIDRSRADTDAQAIGRNSLLQAGWLPPDPPPGHGAHRYAFQVFALAQGPSAGTHPGREAVVAMLAERAIASGLLIGTYERPDGSVRLGQMSTTTTLGPGGLTGA